MLQTGRTSTTKPHRSLPTARERHVGRLTDDFCCSKCQNRFPRVSSLKRHMSQHDIETEHNTCQVCERQFKHTKQYKPHVHSHDKGRHLCPQCGKVFPLAGTLLQHMLVHTDQRPHRCAHCDKGFKKSNNLKQHEMIHSGNKRHACPDCGKSFLLKHHLQQHMITHQIRPRRLEKKIVRNDVHKHLQSQQHTLPLEKHPRMTDTETDNIHCNNKYYRIFENITQHKADWKLTGIDAASVVKPSDNCIGESTSSAHSHAPASCESNVTRLDTVPSQNMSSRSYYDLRCTQISYTGNLRLEDSRSSHVIDLPQPTNSDDTKEFSNSVNLPSQLTSHPKSDNAPLRQSAKCKLYKELTFTHSAQNCEHFNELSGDKNILLDSGYGVSEDHGCVIMSPEVAPDVSSEQSSWIVIVPTSDHTVIFSDASAYQIDGHLMGTDRVQMGTDDHQMASDTDQMGRSALQMGTYTDQTGKRAQGTYMYTDQIGTGDNQMGTSDLQMDICLDKMGDGTHQMGTVEARIVTDIIAVASPRVEDYAEDMGDKLVIDIPEEHDGQIVMCNGVYDAHRNDMIYQQGEHGGEKPETDTSSLISYNKPPVSLNYEVCDKQILCNTQQNSHSIPQNESPDIQMDKCDTSTISEHESSIIDAPIGDNDRKDDMRETLVENTAYHNKSVSLESAHVGHNVPVADVRPTSRETATTCFDLIKTEPDYMNGCDDPNNDYEICNKPIKSLKDHAEHDANRFEYGNVLLGSEDNNSTQRLFLCNLCCKPFKRRNGLKRHLLIHNGLKSHMCTVCGRMFLLKSHAKEHMAVHTGERPYSCSVCAKTFNKATNLTQHMLTHTGERPHVCSYCPKTFAKSTNLKRHMQIHTGDRQHLCAACGAAFFQKVNLKQHMQTHNKAAP